MRSSLNQSNLSIILFLCRPNVNNLHILACEVTPLTPCLLIVFGWLSTFTLRSDNIEAFFSAFSTVNFLAFVFSSDCSCNSGSIRYHRSKNSHRNLSTTNSLAVRVHLQFFFWLKVRSARKNYLALDDPSL